MEDINVARGRPALPKPDGNVTPPRGTSKPVAAEFKRLLAVFSKGYHGKGDRHALLAMAKLNLDIEDSIAADDFDMLERQIRSLYTLRRTLSMQPTNTHTRHAVEKKSEQAARTPTPAAVVDQNPPPGSWREQSPTRH